MNEIIYNIDKEGNNFDYRVVRYVNKFKGKACLINGELETILVINEIHFGANGEIVTMAIPPRGFFKGESLAGETIEDMRHELKWYSEALDKPILNYEFINKQIKLTSEAMKKRYEENEEPQSGVEIAYKGMKDLESGIAKTVSWDDMCEQLGMKMEPLVFEYIPMKEAIKRFKLDTYEEKEMEGE
jgi:hypothetical protein